MEALDAFIGAELKDPRTAIPQSCADDRMLDRAAALASATEVVEELRKLRKRALRDMGAIRRKLLGYCAARHCAESTTTCIRKSRRRVQRYRVQCVCESWEHQPEEWQTREYCGCDPMTIDRGLFFTPGRCSPTARQCTPLDSYETVVCVDDRTACSKWNANCAWVR